MPPQPTPRRHRSISVWLLGLSFCACTSDPDPSELGDMCVVASDCGGDPCIQSGFMGYCTRACAGNTDCPPAWSCAPFGGVAGTVCQPCTSGSCGSDSGTDSGANAAGDSMSDAMGDAADATTDAAADAVMCADNSTTCTDVNDEEICDGDAGFRGCLTDGVRRCMCRRGSWVDCGGCIL